MKNVKKVNKFIEIKTILVYEKKWRQYLVPVDWYAPVSGTQRNLTAMASITAGYAAPGAGIACRIFVEG